MLREYEVIYYTHNGDLRNWVGDADSAENAVARAFEESSKNDINEQCVDVVYVECVG